MKDLQKIKEDLKEFKRYTRKLALDYLVLPIQIQIDYDNLMEEIIHLQGYVDCMIQFEIPLQHEDEVFGC